MDAMKILIAYDGTANSDAAVASLRRAGLPEKAEAIVLTMSDRRLSQELDEQEELEAGVAVAESRATSGLRSARTASAAAAERIAGWFPGWSVGAEVSDDAPAAGILQKITAWSPNLVVVGTHGRSLVGRVLLGSVSQRVLAEARCSVRIGRRTRNEEGPIRLIVGIDGSRDALAAVTEIARRAWPSETEAHLVSAYAPLDLHYAPVVAALEAGHVDEEDWEFRFVREQVEEAAVTLSAAGLKVVPSVRVGIPVPVLLDEAETWSADAIVLGARGHSVIERLLLGSVSSSIAARANCPVDVIRPWALDA